MTGLADVNISVNEITSINVSDSISLETLYIQNNMIPCLYAFTGEDTTLYATSDSSWVFQ